MNKWTPLYAFLFAVAVAGPARADGPQDSSPAPGIEALRERQEERHALKFENSTHNFGEVKEGEHVKVDFKFTNVTDQPVKIEGVKASCGCTAAKPDKEVYEPGESGVIRADFNTANRTGRQVKSITITTDYTRAPTSILRIQGDIVSDVYLKTRVLNFGDVREGVGKKMPVELYDLTEDGIEIESVRLSVRGLDSRVYEPIEYTDPQDEREGRKFVIDVAVPPDQPQGTLRGTMTIQTNYKNRPNFLVSVTGRVVGETIVEPAQAYFGILAPGDTAKRVARLSVVDGGSFELERYEVVETVYPGAKPSEPEHVPAIKVEVEPLKVNSGYQNVTMHCTAYDLEGTPERFDGQVILHGKTSKKEEMIVKIPIRLLVNPQARPRNYTPPENERETSEKKEEKKPEFRAARPNVPKAAAATN